MEDGVATVSGVEDAALRERYSGVRAPGEERERPRTGEKAARVYPALLRRAQPAAGALLSSVIRMTNRLPHPRTAAALVLALAVACGACSGGNEPSSASGTSSTGARGAPSAPGVVLRVDELELTAAEVEPLARDIAELYPEYSTLHVRRLALTNELLTRLALRAVDPTGWAAARDACAAADPAAYEATRVEGAFRGLGLALWSAARHLPEREWSGPIELAGRWVRLRLDRRAEHADVRREELELALLEFPFVPPEEARARMDAALDTVALTLVDPAWDDAVPETFKHRMRR